MGPACAAVSAALPPQARSEVKSHAGPVLTSRAEGGGGFFAHRAFAVVRVVPKVVIDGHIKIFFIGIVGSSKNRAKGARDAF